MGRCAIPSCTGPRPVTAFGQRSSINSARVHRAPRLVAHRAAVCGRPTLHSISRVPPSFLPARAQRHPVAARAGGVPSGRGGARTRRGGKDGRKHDNTCSCTFSTDPLRQCNRSVATPSHAIMAHINVRNLLRCPCDMYKPHYPILTHVRRRRCGATQPRWRTRRCWRRSARSRRWRGTRCS